MGLLLFSHHVVTSYWSILPFVLLILMMASGPVLFERFWHESYKIVSIALGLVVLFWYIIQFRQPLPVVESLSEYVSFITLLVALYIASSGIYLFMDFKPEPITNILFLLAGAIAANIIGTTGASILLIRPFIRLNKYRMKPYLIVFFIFIISNTGGMLTPIGDPPLFLGFLKGVPFFYPLLFLFVPWIVVHFCLLLFFYFLDRNNQQDENEIDNTYHNRIIIHGKRNFIWLGLIVLSIFIDPVIIPSLPYLTILGHHFSFVRELLQIILAVCCLKLANKHAIQRNELKFEPIKEIAFLFFGVFLTMIPVLELLRHAGSNGTTLSLSNVYFATGLASALLDSAPAYLNMLTFSASGLGLSIDQLNEMSNFIASESKGLLSAISVASVVWGAMTYIGNGPNFMIKSIAEHEGIKMPTFFQFIFNYSIPFLLPVLVLIWILFY